MYIFSRVFNFVLNSLKKILTFKLNSPKLCIKNSFVSCHVSCHAVQFFTHKNSECKFRNAIIKPNWFFDFNARCTCCKMKHRHYFKCKLPFHWVNIIIPNFSLQDPKALKLLLMCSGKLTGLLQIWIQIQMMWHFGFLGTFNICKQSLAVTIKKWQKKRKLGRKRSINSNFV